MRKYSGYSPYDPPRWDLLHMNRCEIDCEGTWLVVDEQILARPLKCISIPQPWASLLVWHATKHFITKWFEKTYRGTMGLHASRYTCQESVALAADEQVQADFARYGLSLNSENRWERDGEELPRGQILGVGWLDRTSRCNETKFGKKELHYLPSPSGFAWHFSAVRENPVYVPATGERNIWEFKPSGKEKSALTGAPYVHLTPSNEPAPATR
jgi:hypothetical protein|tara:strand:+ start:79 stop:717 length:639 start_codon:yes stop_codon:yes gene_type:complete